MSLTEEQCRETSSQLPEQEKQALAAEIPGWNREKDAVKREFEFRDFKQAIAFVNKVADLAETQGHHPDIFISYKKVVLTLSTHKAGGLTRNDFIMAARINLLV